MANLETTGRAILQEAPQAFIDIDIEADGIAGYGSILSIGAISPWDDEFYTELKPLHERWLEGNRLFCEDHGLPRKKLIAKGEDSLLTMHVLADWTQDIVAREHKEKAVFSAFNAGYDFPFIDLYMKEAGLENPYGIAGFCIKSLAMALAAQQGQWDFGQTSKGKLPAIFVPEGDFTHNALEDARYQQKIHFRMAAFLCQNYVLRK